MPIQVKGSSRAYRVTAKAGDSSKREPNIEPLPGFDRMQDIHIAFDVDGTLRKNTEERHRTEIEFNPRIVELLRATAHSKNTTVHVWSNRGAVYSWYMVEELGLTDCVKKKNCHLKLWQKMQDEIGASGQDFFRPDIAYDDQQRFDGADKVIVVREK